MKPLLTKSLVFSLFIIVSPSMFGQSVVPKLNFGTIGKTFSNYSRDGAAINSCIALQQDGNMVIGGNTIVRVLPNGAADNTFNTRGFYFDPLMNVVPQSITVKDGIITALYSDAGDTAIILKQITAAGTVNSSYGNNGTIRYGIAGLKLNGYKNILQGDGRMLLIGSAGVGSNTDVLVARLLQNGLPDTSFNHTGYLIIPFEDGISYASTGAIQSDGNIIVTGVHVDNAALQKLFVIRIISNGTIDNSFNATGVFFSAGTGAGNVEPKAVAIQPDDKILIAGNAENKILVIRLTAGGIADESFNGTGTLLTFIGDLNNASGIFVRANKKIVVSAEAEVSPGDPSSWNYGALQLLEDGGPDNSFSVDGKMLVSVSVRDHCVGAVLQDNGRLILTGYGDEARLITMVGVDETGEPDFNFGNGGIRILQLLGTKDNLISLQERQDKKIIAVGTKQLAELDKSNIILMRYKPNGTLDSTFGFNGKAGLERTNTTLLDAAIQQNGKIIACGIIYDEQIFAYRKTIFRFTEDGFLDYSFAPATNFLYPGEPALSLPAAKSVVVYDDDKILFGQNNADVDGNISVTRLTSEGDPDVFFGNNGTKVLSIPGSSYTFSNLSLQTDKKILIAAKKKIDDFTTGFTIIRLTEDGDFDNSFDGDGIKDLPFTSQTLGDNFNLCLSVQYGQKIAVGTTVLSPNGGAFDTSIIIMQLKNDGGEDLSFNGTGVVNISSAEGKSDILQSIATYPDASIYLGCNRPVSPAKQKAFLIKFTPQGKPDSTITSEGSAIRFIHSLDDDCKASDLKVLYDSTILTGSTVFNVGGDYDFLLAAYKARTVSVYKFIGDGDWTDASNWENNTIPPAILPSNGFIFIQPAEGGKCVLNIDQQLQQGSCFVVVAGKNLIVTGNLIIN